MSRTADGAEVAIIRGTIIVYRIFDVAEKFNLERIESDLGAGLASSRLKIARNTGHALILRDAPITLSLGASELRLGAATVRTELFARVWSYGVVSLQFNVPIDPGTTWSALVTTAALVEDENDIDAVAGARVRELSNTLGTAATLPHDPQGMEDYVVYFLEQLTGIEHPGELASRADIPALILGEPNQTLSDDVRLPILNSRLSYSTRDLTVIDWNSALVIDPEGSRDVADMLEFAATHLMELRYFDTLTGGVVLRYRASPPIAFLLPQRLRAAVARGDLAVRRVFAAHRARRELAQVRRGFLSGYGVSSDRDPLSAQGVGRERNAQSECPRARLRGAE